MKIGKTMNLKKYSTNFYHFRVKLKNWSTHLRSCQRRKSYRGQWSCSENVWKLSVSCEHFNFQQNSFFKCPFPSPSTRDCTKIKKNTFPHLGSRPVWKRGDNNKNWQTIVFALHCKVQTIKTNDKGTWDMNLVSRNYLISLNEILL